jgi:toxin YoeB
MKCWEKFLVIYLTIKRSPEFEEQLKIWKMRSLSIFKRIVRMMKEIEQTPGEGIGKPKQLVGGKKYWSRRITHGDRLIYKVDKGCVEFLFCIGHYDDL